MEINDLVNIVGYFIAYAIIGFVMFYFILFRKQGSNLVATLGVIIIMGSIGYGFLTSITFGIINFFVLVIAFWITYILTKMNRSDKVSQERHRKFQEIDYQRRLTRHTMQDKEK